jgi:hypothetical protein
VFLPCCRFDEQHVGGAPVPAIGVPLTMTFGIQR